MSAIEIGLAGSAPTVPSTVMPPCFVDAVSSVHPGTGTPVTAPAVRPEFANAPSTAEEPLCDVEIPLQREWRMAEALAAIGGGPRAERLIERANRPGPVPEGSLLEAIKTLGIAPHDSRLSRAV
jgi:hypothetical protein